MVVALVTLFTLFWVFSRVTSYHFRPDQHDTWKNTRIPSLIDLSEDQNNGSYWSSAFVTTTTRQQFLIVHHQFGSVCKSSVLDLKSLEYWKHVVSCEINATSKTVTSESLNIQFSNFSITSNASDKISELRLSAKSPNYSFTLNVHGRTSKVLLNGGNGVIAWGQDHAECSHWSLPAAQTSGKLALGANRPLDLLPSESFTWYDHQIITAPPPNFTWFEVHFPSTEIRVSIWAYDWPNSSQAWRYATVRIGEQTTLVLPYKLSPSLKETWTSPASNSTFPQAWKLEFENGDHLNLRSVKGDQEIQPGTWTGFVVAENSHFFGQKTGFGVGDVVYL
ncbi:hypothetical protein BS50DRAFT_566739 [Corynespora cassiicola Philippines]|uniref:AttH domain-containing protein n=1 Tax=Corynespora cassiicola Philippines TaxID=1448308 RepID=A0A2T2P8A9_CORCC|nr:hypothetical protein BS50DRAFT_566739 [Corynespora cassiicola Philippines]